MIRRPLLWVAGNSRLQQAITKNPIARRAAHRFVAGEQLRGGARGGRGPQLPGSEASSTCSVRGSTDRPARAMPSAEYEEAAEAIADRGLDATISIKLSQLGQTVDRDACVANLGRILDRAQAVGVPRRDRHGGQQPGRGHHRPCTGKP